jgi:hypothetical protein
VIYSQVENINMIGKSNAIKKIKNAGKNNSEKKYYVQKVINNAGKPCLKKYHVN